MFSSVLKYLRILLILLSGLSYVLVVLCLTVLEDYYYGDFLVLGSASIALFFLTEGFLVRISKKKPARENYRDTEYNTEQYSI